MISKVPSGSGSLLSDRENQSIMRFGQIYWVVTLRVFCYFIYSLDRFHELSTTNKQQPRHFADEETDTLLYMES